MLILQLDSIRADRPKSFLFALLAAVSMVLGGCAGDAPADGPVLSINSADTSADVSAAADAGAGGATADGIVEQDDTSPLADVANTADSSDPRNVDATKVDAGLPNVDLDAFAPQDIESQDTAINDATSAHSDGGAVAPLPDGGVPSDDAGVVPGDGGSSAPDAGIGPVEDAGTGDISGTPVGCAGKDPATFCDDNNQCTVDTCVAGSCVHEDASAICQDANACTDDKCDPAKGCVKLANAATCSDSDTCTAGDACAKSTCVAGQPLACDDSQACTKDSCHPKNGCKHVAQLGPCDDGNQCTTGDSCASGACKPGLAKDCQDNNVCTVDSCDGKDGACAHLANSVACDDADKCTAGDSCSAGKCAPGPAIDCSDNNPCTKATCSVQLGCTTTVTDGACDDGNKCTESDVCKNGKCASGAAKICADNNVCTSDACVGGGCSHTANEAPCDDNNVCTTGDVCSTGSCQPGAKPLVCDDKNLCTADSCSKGKGCVSLPQKATCDDGSICTTGDTCANGKCVGTGGVNCDDNNPCTDDNCKVGTGTKDGCVYAANNGGCEDGNKCTEKDTCKAGKCHGGNLPNCNDGNTCTLGDCTPENGCTQTPVPGECTDGTVCTAGDACKTGKCVAGPKKNCDDSDVCTDDSCAPNSGCSHKLNTAGCEDGNKCTDKDSCSNGACKPGKKKVCTDENTCTNDTCDGKTGCVHVAKPGIVVPKCDGTIHGGKCIRAHAAPLTQARAQVACQKWGGQLVSIANKAENGVVHTEAQARCGTGWAWIGLHDKNKEGAYQWLDNAPLKYTNWNKGEPNNSGNEDVAHMLDGGTWNDHQVTVKLNCYVCKRGLPVGCDDGDKCTSGEVCTTGGKCAAATLDCNDHNGCTVDSCDLKVGCKNTAKKDDTPCGSGVCGKGVCAIGTSAAPATSCQELVGNIGLKPPDAVYWLDPDGKGKIPKFRTFCAFNPGVGWTLAMKINGASKTYRYDSHFWTDSKGHNTKSVNFDTNEAKLAPFWTMPVKSMLVSMKLGSTYKWLAIPVKSASLRAIFATNKPVATKLGRAAWLSLIAGSSLQANCNAEGFNVGDSGAQVRIGIIGNNENTCKSPDSRLGFGGRGNRCNQDTNNSCGNTAKCGGSAGDKNTKVFGYVFIN